MYVVLIIVFGVVTYVFLWIFLSIHQVHPFYPGSIVVLLNLLYNVFLICLDRVSFIILYFDGSSLGGIVCLGPVCLCDLQELSL